MVEWEKMRGKGRVRGRKEGEKGEWRGIRRGRKRVDGGVGENEGRMDIRGEERKRRKGNGEE
jgi:hypothetical protein